MLQALKRQCASPPCVLGSLVTEQPNVLKLSPNDRSQILCAQVESGCLRKDVYNGRVAVVNIAG